MRARARRFAHVDFDLGVGRERRRHVGHADGLLQERRLRAARDLAGRDAVHEHRVTVPRDGAVDHLEADQPPRQAVPLLRLERRRGR